MLSNTKISKGVFGLLLAAFLSWLPEVLCLAGPLSAPVEETLLMFVGEDLEVLEIATRRVESARKAPAIANVVTRQENATPRVF